MHDDKIKVTWNEINQENDGTSTFHSSESCQPSPSVKRISSKPYSIGKIIGILALVIICLVGAYYIAKPNYKLPIENVLATDKNIANDLEGKSAVDAVTIIVHRMRAVDLSSCPTEFKKAYQLHVDAWKKVIPIVREVEKLQGWGNVIANFVAGFISGFTGNFGPVASKIANDVNVANDIKQAAVQVDEEIKSSYYNLLEIARNYGVDTTPYTN